MAEPISLDQAKAQCRIVDDTSQDDLISSYITAAREYVENYTGRALVQREFVDQWDRWGRYMELRWGPVVEVTEVGYRDTDGSDATYDEFVASTDRMPARVYPSLSGWWPSLSRHGGVTVTYTAGYAEGEVPQPLLQAMLLLISQWYSAREAAAERAQTEVPFAVTSLCDQYRGPGL